MAWRLKRFKWESRDMVLKQMEAIEGVRYAKYIFQRLWKRRCLSGIISDGWCFLQRLQYKRSLKNRHHMPYTEMD